jgi:uncharacterized protein (DUF488 family)
MGRTGIANIGYEGRSIGELIDALKADGVRTVVDVRADPVSRRPEFIGTRMARSLEAAGLGYVQVRELGVPRDVRKDAKGAAGKGRLLAWYRDYLDGRPELLGRLVEMSKGPRIAMLCYEREESECHRGVLSERLRAAGVRVDAL